MEFTRAYKSFSILALSFLLLFTLNGYADGTIKSTSVDWNDITSREELLRLVPTWQHESLTEAFRGFLDPRGHNLPYMLNGERVDANAMFIHAFWGPLDNPFVKFPRPAKAFIFLPNGQYFMAPVVKDASDQDYYAFDNTMPHPIPLIEWIANKTHGEVCAVHFNICTGYGAKPSQSCDDTTLENEIYLYPEQRATGTMQSKQSSAFALPSQKREAYQDWHEIDERLQAKQPISYQSIVRGSVAWSDLTQRRTKLADTVDWPNFTLIEQAFKKIRDLRYFSDENIEKFGRRISWLFPDDGCWTRVSAMFQHFFGPKQNFANNTRRPSKVYVFGNLCANTPNTASGSIRWWYHAAPVVRLSGSDNYYVIDPSINPYAPTPLATWVNRITDNQEACAGNDPGEVKFNICNGYGVNPYDLCEYTPYEDFGKEVEGMLINRYYRRFEWKRQVELGRDPKQVLGDNPPWG